MTEYPDKHKYSDDRVYRWWYERRWGPGPSLCWVGLNPSTGDSAGRPRPTLRKVVQLARDEAQQLLADFDAALAKAGQVVADLTELRRIELQLLITDLRAA